MKIGEITDIMKSVKDIIVEKNNIGADNYDNMRKQYKKYLSKYAFESVDEFVAESIAEYMNGKCRPLARQVVEVLIRGR